jgi:hypothetical protein
MDNFYTIVLIIAVIALIGILTYIGIIMSYGEGTVAYPPHSNTCPDYWEVTQDEEIKCKIPLDGEKNTGHIYDNGGLDAQFTEATPGITEGNGSINFADEEWKAVGSELCAKKDWANKFGIIWDGISNYNDC